MDEHSLKKWELELLAKEAELRQMELQMQKSRKLSIAAIVSVLAIVISGLQVWVSIEQRSVSEAQAVQQYIPHLIKDDTRDLALSSLRNYFDEEFIVELSKNYKSTNTLRSLVKSGNLEIQEKAKKALESIESQRMSLISGVFSDSKTIRIQSSNELISNWKNDPLLTPDLIDYSMENFSNENGVYNAAVILQQIDVVQLKSSADVVLPFVQKINGTNRTKTKKLVSDLLKESAS